MPCCGHNFHPECLATYFEQILKKHLERRPLWRLDRDHPWTSPEEIEKHPKDARDHLRISNILYDGPEFICPMCRRRIARPPPESRSQIALVEAIAKVRKEPDPRDDQEEVRQRVEMMKTLWKPFW